MKDPLNQAAQTTPPTSTGEPDSKDHPSKFTFDQWVAQMPALTRKMATDPVFRAEVEARTV